MNRAVARLAPTVTRDRGREELLQRELLPTRAVRALHDAKGHRAALPATAAHHHPGAHHRAAALVHHVVHHRHRALDLKVQR